MLDKKITLQEVADKTGISKHTLRNWEKRYLELSVERDLSGNRIYGDEDVEKILFIKEHIDKGLTPSSAINLLTKSKKQPYHFDRYSKEPSVVEKKSSKVDYKKLIQLIRSAIPERCNDISRICLTKRPFKDNELIVIDSEETLTSFSDMMSPYYRCLVSKNSSIFEIEDGSIRTYSLTSDIINTFSDRKPQKSVDYLYQLGHKSGLCMPCQWSKDTIGYLFLNSFQEGYFDEWYANETKLINHLRSLWDASLSEINQEVSFWSETASHYPIDSHLHHFEKKEFEQKVVQISEDGQISKSSVYFDHFNGKFIYRPIVLIDFLKQVFAINKKRMTLTLKNGPENNLKILVKCNQVGDDTSLLLPPNDDVQFHQSYGLKFFGAKKEIEISFPVEYHFEPELGYSVYF